MMNDELFEAALGIAEPWHVVAVDLDAEAKTLTIRIDFTAGSRFAVAGGNRSFQTVISSLMNNRYGWSPVNEQEIKNAIDTEQQTQPRRVGTADGQLRGR